MDKFQDRDLKEEMQGWDVDDERIAKLTAEDEEAKRVPRRVKEKHRPSSSSDGDDDEEQSSNE